MFDDDEEPLAAVKVESNDISDLVGTEGKKNLTYVNLDFVPRILCTLSKTSKTEGRCTPSSFSIDAIKRFSSYTTIGASYVPINSFNCAE